MKELTKTIEYKIAQLDELSTSEQELVRTAMQATDHSYAKYSGFRVGAACLLDNGQVVVGANQENAAYPSGLCAERTAIFAAQANYPDHPVTTLAIAARNAEGFTKAPISPCGACRQVILEVESRYDLPVRILLYGTDGILCIRSVKDLLPFCFVDECMR